jgi:hypothetical protein
MDRRQQALKGWLLAGLVCGCVWGCADRKAEYEPVPYGVYDSPMIASASPADHRASTPQSEASRRPAAESRPQRESPPDEWRGDPDQEPINDRSTSSSNNENDTGSKDRPSSIRDAARYVAAVYRLNEVSLTEQQQSSIPALYRKCRANHAVYTDGPPAAGDLVFFHNTVDANDDGRNNDWYTHVGLVEWARNGVVSVLSYRDGSVQSFRMSLEHTSQRRHDGQVVNAQIRPKQSGDPPYSQYLAGELFAGYCSLLGDVSELVVIDNWQPGMKIDAPN